MERELKEVSLENLGNGAAIELFNEELRKVLNNIGDINTLAKQPRVVVLKVTIRPSEERDAASIEILASSKLAACKPFGTYMFMGLDGNRVRAYESNPKQPELPGLSKIIEMGGKEK